MTAALSLVGVSHVASPLRDQDLLAFKATGHPIVGCVEDDIYRLSFDDGTRNIMVFGGTGRGKTAAVLLPGADRLVSSGCSGLILDAKGDYALLAYEHPERVLRIGPDGNFSLNLIGDINTATLRALLESLRRRYTTRDSYWGSTGVEDAVLAFLYYRELGRSPTLADIVWSLLNPESFCTQLERFLRSEVTLSPELLRQIESRSSDEFGLLRVGKFRGREPESTHAAEQYTWQTNAILKSLTPFYANTELRRAFCGDQPLSVQSLLYEQNQVLVLDMNSDKYPDVAHTTGRILRLLLMQAISTFPASRRRKLCFGTERFTFLLIDEYQHYIHVGESAGTDALRDDNTWLDRSRSYDHINVLATQAVSSLLAQADKRAVDVIIQNCQSTITLPTTDSQTLERVTLLSGYPAHHSHAHNALLHPSGIGEGFIHIGNHRGSSGGSLCGPIVTGRLTEPEHSFMNRFIMSPPVGADHGQATPFEKEQNPFRSSHNRIASSGRLFVVNEGCVGEARMIVRYARSRPALAVHRWDLRNPLARAFEPLNDIQSRITSFKDGDILLCLAALCDPETSILNNSKLASLIDELNQFGVITICGIQCERIVEIERRVSLPLPDPEHAVQVVIKMLSNYHRPKESQKEPEIPLVASGSVRLHSRRRR